jgi:hypothetical protein
VISFLLFAVLSHVGGQPSPWEAVSGANKVEYRWSRPAGNSCSIEFHNLDASQSSEFTAVTTFAMNRAVVPVLPNVPGPTKDNRTIVREQMGENRLLVRVVRFGTNTISIDDCYRVVLVKASVLPQANQNNIAAKPKQ